MKALIAIVIIVGLSMGGYQIYSYWHEVKEEKKTHVAEAAPALSGRQLSGMAETLEAPLEAAQRQGASGLRKFLAQYGKTIDDPRRASIELDYVVLVANDDLAEARKVFARVQQRVTPSSPVYARVQQLEKTYQ
ncbi:MAG: hypothetical protein ABJC04_01300 [Verrucomicrobiota bacterium]